MNDQEKSREELLKDLKKLRLDYASLKATYEKDIAGWQQVDAEGQMREANFHNLAESIQNGIFIVSSTGKHLYANKHAIGILGYTPDEILHPGLKDLADPKALPVLQQRLKDRIAGKPVSDTYETNVRRKDGTSFPAEVSGSKTKWLGQDCDMVLFRDITTRMKIVNQLKESEEKYRNLIESSLIGVLMSTINGEILYLNDAIVKMLEADNQNEIIRMGSLIRYKHPEQREHLIEILKKDRQANGFEATIRPYQACLGTRTGSVFCQRHPGPSGRIYYRYN